MKSFSIVVLSIMATALVAVAFASAVPDYTVEFSAVSGKCKNVEHKGIKVSDGCKQVAAGKITRYTQVNGY